MSDRERATAVMYEFYSGDLSDKSLVDAIATALAQARAEGLRQAAALLADCAQWDPECPHAAKVRALAEGGE